MDKNDSQNGRKWLKIPLASEWTFLGEVCFAPIAFVISQKEPVECNSREDATNYSFRRKGIKHPKNLPLP